MKLMLNYCLLMAVITTLTGCSKFTKFDVPYSADASIQATPLIGLLGDIYTPDITTNSEQVFANNNTRSDLIESITLKSLRFSITSPTGKTFNFLKSADVFLSAEGLSEIKIASISNIDDATAGSSIDLSPVNQELKDYLKKSDFKIKVTSTTDRIITESINIKIDAVFFVDAKILGM